MKKKIYFLSVIFSLFALSGILTSCENLNWFTNFMDDLNALKVPFTFYSAAGGTGTSFEKSYIIGKTISGEQLVNDSKDFILKNGADGSTPYRSHAVVHGLKKSSVSSGDDGVVVDGNGIVTSVNVKEAVSFVPVIWYKAILNINLQDLDNPSHHTFSKSFNLYGPENNTIDESSFVNLLYNFPGFECNSFDSNKFFSSSDVTEVGVYYARKNITLTFNANGGSFTSGNNPYEITKPFETLTEGYVPQDLERLEYTFMGWNPPVPETFPAADATFTAVWSVTPQDITYMTVNACNSENHFSNLIRNIVSLPSQYTPGEKTIIPNPEIFLLNPGDNDMLFDGWYYNETGDSLVKLPIDNNNKYYIDTGKTGPLTLCAKWLPKYVYVNPTIADTDELNGFEKESAVKTIANAKLLMKENLHGQEIRVVGTLTDESDINELSETYGNGCRFGVDGNGVKIIAQAYPLINFNSTNIALENVYIDGDASFVNSNDIMNTVDKKTAKTDPLIKMDNSNLTLTNCTITNCDYSGSESLIKAGSLTINGTTINYCRARNGNARVPICEISKVQGNVTVDGNGIISNCDGIAISEQEDKQMLSFGGTIFNCYEGIVHNCTNSAPQIYGTIKNCTSYPLQVTKNNGSNTNYYINLSGSAVIQDNVKPVIIGKGTYVIITSATVKNNGEENLILDDEDSSIFLSDQSTNINHIHYNNTGAYIRVRQSYNTSRAYDLTFNNVENFVGKVIIKDTGSGDPNVNIISTKASFRLPSGYAITDDGKLAKASGTTITIDDPVIPTGYNLGTITQTSAELSGGSATVRINIPAETYEQIDDWGDGSSVEKYVMYTYSLQTGTFKSRINSAGDGTYYADIKIGKATTTENVTSAEITSSGLANIFVFANPEADNGSVAITGTEAVILVY